jgi:uncharacterized DUF497 family protein
MRPGQRPGESREVPHRFHRGNLGVRRSPGADFADEDHSAGEQREIIIGHSPAKRLLLVCFTERADGRVRIISTRRATRKERHDYEDYISP